MWSARPTSRATASASRAWDCVHSVGSLRWRAKTPITWSKTSIGVASAARVSSRSSVSTPPSSGSSSRGSSSTSSTATVRRSRMARLETARYGAAAPIGGVLWASHSARMGVGAPGSPRRMKQRATSAAFPTSSTAMRSTVSTSCSERTRLAISATSRSRPSASSSCAAERVFSSARAVSPASASRRAISCGGKCRRRLVLATTRTASTRAPETIGTNAALFAPTRSARRRLTRGEDSTSKIVSGAASKAALATAEGSCSRSIRTDRNQPASSPSMRATSPVASLRSSLISMTAANSISRRATTSSRSARATDAASLARAKPAESDAAASGSGGTSATSGSSSFLREGRTQITAATSKAPARASMR